MLPTANTPSPRGAWMLLWPGPCYDAVATAHLGHEQGGFFVCFSWPVALLAVPGAPMVLPGCLWGGPKIAFTEVCSA